MWGGLKKFFRKANQVMSKIGNVLDFPGVDIGINVASVFLPPLHALRMLKVYKKVRLVEEAFQGQTGNGPLKFLEVWKALDSRDWAPKELKKWIELSVLVLDGQVAVHDSDTQGKIHDFQAIDKQPSD